MRFFRQLLRNEFIIIILHKIELSNLFVFVTVVVCLFYQNKIELSYLLDLQQFWRSYICNLTLLTSITSMDIQQPNQAIVQKKIQNYVFNLSQKIGQGSFSMVYRGININNNNNVAIKKIRISDMKSKIAKRLLDCQISILKLINHPNIVRCLDVFCSVNNCYIVTEYCSGGNLDQKLKNSRKIHEQELKKIIYYIYKALQYLGSLNIIHRDIKVTNILIHEGQFKIADFGFAIRASQPFKDIPIGSPVYMSPQGLIHNIYGPKSDVWAFGLLIYQLIHGTTPLQSCKTEEQLKTKILLPPKISNKIPTDLKQLILSCLKINESQRISIQQLGRTPYLLKLASEFQCVSTKDLTETIASTSSSISENSYYYFPQLNIQGAASLLNYCHLIQKLQKYTDKSCFKKCLSWAASYLFSARYDQRLLQKKQFLQAIRQSSRHYTSIYGLSYSQKYDFKQIMQESLKIISIDKINGRYFSYFKSQTQLLIKAIQLKNIQFYAKQTKIKQFIHLIPQ